MKDPFDDPNYAEIPYADSPFDVLDEQEAVEQEASVVSF